MPNSPVQEEIRLLRSPGRPQTVTVGRAEGDFPEHVTLDHPSIRKMHARIHHAEGAWSIESLVDDAPVLVNGNPVPPESGPRPLTFGDRVRIGAAGFDFHLPPDMEPVAAPERAARDVPAIDPVAPTAHEPAATDVEPVAPREEVEGDGEEIDVEPVGPSEVVVAHLSSDHGPGPTRDASLAVVLDDGRQLVAVADAADGGPEWGASVGETALRSLASRIRAGDDLAEALEAACAAAREISGRELPAALAAAVGHADRVRVANVGDARVYIRTARGLREITRRPGADGTAGPEGAGPEAEVRTFGPFELDPDDRIVLCSDGVHGVVGPREMEEVVGGCDDPLDVPDRLLRRALESGSAGDAAVAVFAVPGRPPPAVPERPPEARRSPGEKPWDPVLLMKRSRNPWTHGERRSWLVAAALALALVVGAGLLAVILR